jgi:hypothetical protein
MSRWGVMAAWIGTTLTVVSLCTAQPTVRIWNDPVGDAVIRRTDLGNSGELLPETVLPDLVQVRLSGWHPTDPSSDPYAGVVVPGNGADIFRLDVVFHGMFNPPGPLGLGGQPYDPFRFGPSPIYGFLEFDIDNCNDTGGELGGAATLRYLANAARFGGLPTGATSGRAARSGNDFDFDFYTDPQFERSGEDFALALCGCFPVSLISVDTHTWIVQSRYFQRAGGYRDASGVIGGSADHLYDPMVKLRFQQDPDPGTNTTTITLVYPLTMHGAALLLGLQTDPPIDHIIDIGGNPSSVVEALSDIIEGASENLEGPVWDLTHLWVNRNAADYLDPTAWNATAIFGTAYATPQANALYVWTDVGFSQTVGDVTGDGLADSADRNALIAYINAHDGDDGVIDNSVSIPNFGANFSLYDINYDGVVDSHDLMIYPPACASDWNNDGDVNSTDFFLFLFDFFNGNADFNHDGVVDSFDFFGFLNAFFHGC